MLINKKILLYNTRVIIQCNIFINFNNYNFNVYLFISFVYKIIFN